MGLRQSRKGQIKNKNQKKIHLHNLFYIQGVQADTALIMSASRIPESGKVMRDGSPLNHIFNIRHRPIPLTPQPNRSPIVDRHFRPESVKIEPPNDHLHANIWLSSHR